MDGDAGHAAREFADPRHRVPRSEVVAPAVSAPNIPRRARLLAAGLALALDQPFRRRQPRAAQHVTGGRQLHPGRVPHVLSIVRRRSGHRPHLRVGESLDVVDRAVGAVRDDAQLLVAVTVAQPCAQRDAAEAERAHQAERPRRKRRMAEARQPRLAGAVVHPLVRRSESHTPTTELPAQGALEPRRGPAQARRRRVGLGERRGAVGKQLLRVRAGIGRDHVQRHTACSGELVRHLTPGLGARGHTGARNQVERTAVVAAGVGTPNAIGAVRLAQIGGDRAGVAERPEQTERRVRGEQEFGKRRRRDEPAR